MKTLIFVILQLVLVNTLYSFGEKENKIMYYNYEQPTFFFSIPSGQFSTLPPESSRKLVLEESPGTTSDCISEKFEKVEIELNFRRGQGEYDFGLITTSVSIEVNFQAVLLDQNNTVLLDNILCTLDIKTNTNGEIDIPESVCLTDVTDLVNENIDDYNIKFVLNSINVTGTPEPIDVLEARLIVERSVELISSPSDWIEIIDPSGQDLSSSSLPTYPQVDFKWKLENTNCSDDEVPFYQIQLLRLYNSSLDKVTDPKNITTKIDWNKALNFEVSGTRYNEATPSVPNDLIYTISITEGTGYYLWRIRPIGDFYKNYTNKYNSIRGGIADDRNWGEWLNPSYNSNPIMQGDVIDISNYLLIEGGFYFQQFDEEINWKYERIFTEGEEDSKILEKITYADNLLNIRQNQKYIVSDESKIVSQTIYDYAGRPAITTLPVPFDKNAVGNLGYQKGFIKNGSYVYQAKHFDDGRFDPSMAPLNNYNPSSVTTSDLLDYYDGNNTSGTTVLNEERVPSSTFNTAQSANDKAIPYKRNLYENNSFSEIKETSGFGEPFSFGSTSTGDNRTTEILRVDALPQEIINVLGNETPRAGGIRKTIKQDPNGVITIEYHNSLGKLIATAVKKNPESINLNLEELDYDNNLIEKEKLNSNLIEYKFENKTYNEEGYSESIKLNLTEIPFTTLSFNHLFHQSSIQLDCYYIDIPESNCISCYDKVTIDIIDAKTLTRPAGFSIVEFTNDYSVIGTCPAPSIIQPTTVNLPPGTYIIKKTVITNKDEDGYSPKQDIVNKVENSILTNYNSSLSTIISLLDDVIDGISEMSDVYEALDLSPDWDDDIDVVSNLKYYYYTKSSEIDDECCEIRIYEYDCASCPGDLITDDGMGNYTSKFQKKLIEEINAFLLDNGIDEADLPRRPNDGFELRHSPNDANIIDNYAIYPYFFRDDYKNESALNLNNLYDETSIYDNMFDEMIKNMLEDNSRDFQEEELCDCWSNSINLLKYNGINLISTSPGYQFVESFDLMDSFLSCVDKKYDANDSEKDICYDGYTYHAVYTNNPVPSYAPKEGYLSHAYKYFYFDPNNDIKQTCLDNLGISIDLNNDEWIVWDKETIPVSYDIDASATGSCAPLTDPANVSQRYHLIYTKLYGCIRNEITVQEADAAWPAGMTFCGFTSYSDMIDNTDFDAIENIQDIVNCLNDACDDKCESKFDEFVPRLIRLFNESGLSVQGQSYYQNSINTIPDYSDPNGSDSWDLVERYRMYNSPHNGHEIDMEEIYCMATALVDNCKSYCDVTTKSTPPVLDISPEFKKVFQSDFELELPLVNPLSCTNGGTLVNNISNSADIAPRWGKYIEEVMNRLLDELILYNPNIPADWDEFNYYVENPNTGSIEYSGAKTEVYHYRNKCLPNMGFKFTFWKNAYQNMEYDNSGEPGIEIDDLNDYNANLIRTMLGLLSNGMCITYVHDAGLCRGGFLKYGGYRDGSGYNDIWHSLYLFEGDLADPLTENVDPASNGGILWSDLGREKITKVEFEWISENELNLLFFHNIEPLTSPNQNYSNPLKFNIFDTQTYGTYLNEICSPNITYSCDEKVCFKWKDSYEVPDDAENIAEINVRKSCDNLIASKLKLELQTQIGTCAADIASNVADKYDDICKNPFIDDLTVSYTGPDYYHYTLYYYDRAGNLIKTVPPNGIEINNSATRSTTMGHTFQSEYKYDSRDFLVEEKIPDRTSESVFIYNTVDQLTFSYDARQFDMNNIANTSYYYSYSIYDEQGRIIETGESEADPTDMTTNGFAANEIKEYLTYIAANPTRLKNFFENNLDRKMFISTVYGYQLDPLLHHNMDPGFPAQGINLRNRINYTLRDEDGDDLTTNDRVKTYYSYDLHGNVEWVMNDIAAEEFKIPLPFRFIGLTRYDYDLISGNVKNVYYNPGRNDSYFHRYEYDEDQRIKMVETSRYGRIWDKDSKYQYYKHGPLKRIEIGDDNLQGIDYTYTINGWLKAINHSVLSASPLSSLDPRKDGFLPGTFEKDAFGMVLSYFDDDYWNSSLTHFNQNIIANYAAGNELFNGNIRNWSFSEYNYANLNSNIQPQYPENTQAFAYKYDVLNRILTSDENSYNKTGNNWSAPLYDDYKSDYEYDPNGNILNLNRNANAIGSNSEMDELEYDYSYAHTGLPKNNQLLRVDDPLGQARGNDYPGAIGSGVKFLYDGSGNLIKDEASFIDKIEWTSDGKIKKINFLMNPNSNVTSIEFGYDAMGNRISKKVNVLSAAAPTTEYTYYMREANGNVMAVYENDGDPSDIQFLCFRIKFYCTNIDDFVEREICTDDFYINQVEDKIYVYTAESPLLDCFGNEIVFSEIKIGIEDNRFEIVVSPTSNPPLVYSYYDYSMIFNGNTGLNLAEWHIWGSGSEGRVGIRRPERDKLHYFDDYINYPFPTNNFSRYIRYKDYELKDHLGNVRATITDLKLKDGARFKVDLSSANTYYPFGMHMPERNWSNEWYRYGFQGQEKDDEIKGEGNSIATEFRMNDTRLGRWLSIDPKYFRFPSQSTFVSMDNSPINLKDPNGDATIADHIEMDMTATKQFRDGLDIFQNIWYGAGSWISQGWADGVKFMVAKQHLDNMSNSDLRPLIENGDFLNDWDNHQIQDFYFHSNYIEIMKVELGYSDGEIPTLEDLDMESEEGKVVLSKIRTTNYYGHGKSENDPYSHDVDKGEEQRTNDDYNKTGAFNAKDNEKHENYNEAIRLGTKSTLNKIIRDNTEEEDEEN
jgi:hypothetical protein